MKLSEWARQQGVSYRTAWNWFRAGVLPVPARQLPTGTILVDVPGLGEDEGTVAIYARVSSSDQQSDLDGQVARVARHLNERGMAVARTVTEVGSGLNGRRRKLVALLADPTVKVIAVEHRERLARFGIEYLEAALAAQGRRIVVVEEGEVEDDLVRDMTEVLTSFCARLYGRRSARHRAERALRCAAEPVPSTSASQPRARMGS